MIIMTQKRTAVHSSAASAFPILRGNDPLALGITKISNKAGLIAMADNLAGSYYLSADIEVDDSWTPIGSAATPFTGYLFGRGHTISKITQSSANVDQGLFGVIDGGQVVDLVLNDCVFTGGDCTGCLAGQILNGYVADIRFKDCEAHGEDNVGLVAGTMNASSAELITIGVDCKCEASGYNCGMFAGLVLGKNAAKSYTIQDSMALGAAEANDCVGGGVGNTYSSAVYTNCYTLATVTATAGTPSDVGGFCGYNDACTFNDVFYDMDTAGLSDTGKGEPKSRASLWLNATFTNWDFDNVWIQLDPTSSESHLVVIPATASVFSAKFVIELNDTHVGVPYDGADHFHELQPLGSFICYRVNSGTWTCIVLADKAPGRWDYDLTVTGGDTVEYYYSRGYSTSFAAGVEIAYDIQLPTVDPNQYSGGTIMKVM